MAEFIPSEKGVPIRMPSTANLMIDSADRDVISQPANSFYINKRASLLNGFFTRISSTEVVMEWNTPNITNANNTFSIILDPAGPSPQPATATLSVGFYTIEQALNEIGTQLTTTAGGFPNPPGSPTFAVALVGNQYVFRASAPAIAFTIQVSPLAEQLFPGLVGFTATSFPIQYGDLRPTRYIDFTSPQLTYNQDLKDNTSSNKPQDVLVRWYFAFSTEQATDVDGYDMPILMGYAPFYIRRAYNPPKQIKWTANQPIGQVQFVLYDSNGNVVNMNNTTNWLMTLQVSEV